jgi:hypothetical protein
MAIAKNDVRLLRSALMRQCGIPRHKKDDKNSGNLYLKEIRSDLPFIMDASRFQSTFTIRVP